MPLPECLLGTHDDCAHAYTIREAPDGEHGLCQCECHASCPLAGTSPVSDADWRSSCTCPGAATIWRNQELAGIDPAEIARRMKGRRRPTRTESLVRAYKAAAAQAAGRRPSDHEPLGDPRLAMNFLVDLLAGWESDAEAARLLGLTDAEVAAARNAADEFRIAAMLDQVKASDRRKRKLAKRMAEGMARSR
jgi:hypothetical protein